MTGRRTMRGRFECAPREAGDRPSDNTRAGLTLAGCATVRRGDPWPSGESLRRARRSAAHMVGMHEGPVVTLWLQTLRVSRDPTG